MSILDAPIWPELLPYIKVETYDRDGSARDPRVRLELRRMPGELTRRALELESPCVECGKQIHPVRARQPPENKRSEVVGHGLYIAAACDQDTTKSCSRGKAARREYVRVKRAVRLAWKNGLVRVPQLELMGDAGDVDDQEGARRAIERRHDQA